VKASHASRKSDETARQSLEASRQSLEASRQSVEAARQSAETARQSAETTMGQAETSLRQAISQSRQRMSQLGVEIGTLLNGRRRDELNASDTRRLSAYEGPFKEAMEDNLNAYEDACAKYIDNKIDRVRFKKMYVHEIQKLCECDAEHPHYSLMNPEGASKFQAIWKVYREWHHHEK
jgi:hypothetical protein